MSPLKISTAIAAAVFFAHASFAATVLTDSNGTTVAAQTADGNAVQLNEGDEILAGTDLHLSKDQSVTVSTDTGMNVVADQGAKVKVSNDDDGVPLFEVALGEVRAFLSPTEPKPAVPAPRLRVTTPGAVVGVRGTDFVVNSAQGGTDVHTLEGTVEVAGSREDLKAGRTTPLGQGEGVEGVHAGAPMVKKTFNRDEFMNRFNKRHPQLAKLHARAETRRARFKGALREPRQQNFKNWQEHRQQMRARRQQSAQHFLKAHPVAAKWRERKKNLRNEKQK